MQWQVHATSMKLMSLTLTFRISMKPNGMNFYMYTNAVMAIVDDSITSDCISTLAFVLSISVYRAFFICSMMVSVSSISSTSLLVASWMSLFPRNHFINWCDSIESVCVNRSLARSVCCFFITSYSCSESYAYMYVVWTNPQYTSQHNEACSKSRSSSFAWWPPVEYKRCIPTQPHPSTL